MLILAFEIPGDPVAKGRPKMTTFNGHARAYTPAKTRSYESLVKLACAQAMGTSAPFDEPLAIEILVRLSVPESWSRKRRGEALAGRVLPTKRPDLDNFVKAILDGMGSVAFVDDARAVDLVVKKRYAETPGVLVRLSRVEGVCA